MSEDNVLRHEIGRLQALNHAAAETFARQIGVLRAQLAASRERERILREGLGFYADPCNWDGGYIASKRRPAEAALKAAEEVKG